MQHGIRFTRFRIQSDNQVDMASSKLCETVAVSIVVPESTVVVVEKGFNVVDHVFEAWLKGTKVWLVSDPSDDWFVFNIARRTVFEDVVVSGIVGVFGRDGLSVGSCCLASWYEVLREDCIMTDDYGIVYCRH